MIRLFHSLCFTGFNRRFLTDPFEHFSSTARELMEQIRRDEKANIEKAANLCHRRIADDRLIHVFGVSGHSVIGCEEFFWRAGGLCPVAPLFDASLNLSGGGIKSTLLERVPGVGDKVVRAGGVGPGDLLIITSIYGMNAATIDAALAAREVDATVVAITSKAHAEATPADFPARHPSGKNLADLAEVTIDNHVPHGDCVVRIEGCLQPLGPVSTILVSTCVQWLVMETVRRCVEAGLEAPVWRSANTVGGDESNQKFMERYAPRIKAL